MPGKTAAALGYVSRPRSILPRITTSLNSHVHNSNRVEQAARNIALRCTAPNTIATPPSFNNQTSPAMGILKAYYHASSRCLTRCGRSKKGQGRVRKSINPNANDKLDNSKQELLKCSKSKTTDKQDSSKQEDQKCIKQEDQECIELSCYELCKRKHEEGKSKEPMKPDSLLFKMGIQLPNEPPSSEPKEKSSKVKIDKITDTPQDGIILPTPPRHIKATLLGCNGRVGQVLALLLKQCLLITELSLYDIYKIPQSVTSLKDIDTNCQVSFHEGRTMLNNALTDSDIVIFAAGVPRSTGLSKNELFCSNAEIVKELTCACAVKCPQALMAIITNPINSMVPIASEVLELCGKYDPKRVFGVANTHVVRSCAIMGEHLDKDPKCVYVPVVGGITPNTMVPVLSQTKPCVSPCLDPTTAESLVCKIREAGISVVRLKENKGASNLCTAYAAARFINCLAKGINKENNIVECAYVRSDIVKGCKYFVSPVQLGPEGIVHNYGIPRLNAYECELLVEAIPKLQEEIQTGEEFAKPKTFETVSKK